MAGSPAARDRAARPTTMTTSLIGVIVLVPPVPRSGLRGTWPRASCGACHAARSRCRAVIRGWPASVPGERGPGRQDRSRRHQPDRRPGRPSRGTPGARCRPATPLAVSGAAGWMPRPRAGARSTSRGCRCPRAWRVRSPAHRESRLAKFAGNHGQGAALEGRYPIRLGDGAACINPASHAAGRRTALAELPPAAHRPLRSGLRSPERAGATLAGPARPGWRVAGGWSTLAAAAV